MPPLGELCGEEEFEGEARSMIEGRELRLRFAL